MAVLERVLNRQVRYVTPAIGSELAAAVCGQIRRDAGAVLPPYAAHLPAPGLLAACWAITREPVAGTAVRRVVKEAVGAAVSATNACPYCVDVHTATMYGLEAAGAGSAIVSGRDGRITDPELREIVRWARATRSPGAALLAHPPFPPASAAELVGTALSYHYINRMVSIFLVDSPFGAAWAEEVKRTLKRLAAPATRRVLSRPLPRGDALELLPRVKHEAEYEAVFGWAKADPVIAAAFTAGAAAFDEAGRRWLPASVVELVSGRLRDWHGEAPPLSRDWVERAVAGLPASGRPAGRLALLAALAPYQVDAHVVDEFRASTPGGDEALVGATAWASFAATLRVSEWISPEQLARGHRPGPTGDRVGG